jgi:hypothetical protein
MTQILGRHRVVGLVHLDVGITMDRPLPFVEEREPRGRQGQEGRLLGLLEELLDLLLRGAVDAVVGDLALPPIQVRILFGQGAKDAALQGVIADILYARFRRITVP